MIGQLGTSVLPLCLLAFALSSWTRAEDPPTRTVKKEESYTTQRDELRDVTVTRQKQQRFTLIIFDHSGSMGPLLNENKERVRQLLEQNWSNPQFVVGAVPFAGCYATDAELLARSISPAPNRQQQVWDSVRNLTADGATDLARALRVSLTYLTEDSYADVVLLTDNADTCNGNLNGLVAQLQNTQVTKQEKQRFTVTERKIRIHVLSEATGQSKVILKKLASTTGGKFLDTAEKQDRFLDELGKELSTVSHGTREPGAVGETEEARQAREIEVEEEAKAQERQRERAVQTQRLKEKKKEKQ